MKHRPILAAARAQMMDTVWPSDPADAESAGGGTSRSFGPPDRGSDALELNALAETEALDRVLEMLRRELDIH